MEHGNVEGVADVAKVPILSPDDAFVGDEEDHVDDGDNSEGVELDEESWCLDADEGEEDEDEEERNCRIDVPNAVVEL